MRSGLEIMLCAQMTCRPTKDVVHYAHIYMPSTVLDS